MSRERGRPEGIRLPGERGISRPTIAQGRPCVGLHLYAAVRFFLRVHFRAADRGCRRHSAFPAPSWLERVERRSKARADCAARTRRRAWRPLLRNCGTSSRADARWIKLRISPRNSPDSLRCARNATLKDIAHYSCGRVRCASRSDFFPLLDLSQVLRRHPRLCGRGLTVRLTPGSTRARGRDAARSWGGHACARNWCTATRSPRARSERDRAGT